MGFDIDRFEGQVNEGLLCVICHDVLEEPLQAPCEHAFCSACIHAWLLEDNSCPVDRQMLLTSELKPLHRYMSNDLHSLVIFCVNKENGCQHKASLDSIQQHESTCDFATLPCPACQKDCVRAKLGEHTKICQLRSAGLVPTSDIARLLEEISTRQEQQRQEWLSKLTEQRQEMDLRLEAHRRHLVQRENELRTEMENIRSLYSKQNEEIKRLLKLEKKNRAEVERLAREKQELLHLLQGALVLSNHGGSQIEKSHLHHPPSIKVQMNGTRLPEKVTDL